MGLLISRAITNKSNDSGPAANRGQGPKPRPFVCEVGLDVFVVVAKNIGQVWLVIMDRYKVEHPSALPKPRRVVPDPMVVAGHSNGTVSCSIDDYPTKPVEPQIVSDVKTSKNTVRRDLAPTT